MEHEQSDTCWCEPELIYLDDETNIPVYLHREVH